MESLDFVLIVIPLSIIVATLAALVYYYAHKEEINSRKNAKLVQSFVEKRVRQQAAIRSEVDRIDNLYKNRNIDKSTYESLQNVILMSQEKQRFEAIATFNDKTKILNSELPTIPESPQVGKEQEQGSWLENEMPHEEREEEKAKDKTREKQKRKRARKRKTKKKGTEIGLINSANTSEHIGEEEFMVPPN